MSGAFVIVTSKKRHDEVVAQTLVLEKDPCFSQCNSITVWLSRFSVLSRYQSFHLFLATTLSSTLNSSTFPHRLLSCLPVFDLLRQNCLHMTEKIKYLSFSVLFISLNIFLAHLFYFKWNGFTLKIKNKTCRVCNKSLHKCQLSHFVVFFVKNKSQVFLRSLRILFIYKEN